MTDDPIYDVDPDDAMDRWRECRECGAPIGHGDELCRNSRCDRYGKHALSTLVQAAPKSDLLTAFMSSGTYDPPRSTDFWDRLLVAQKTPEDLFGPIEVSDLSERRP